MTVSLCIENLQFSNRISIVVSKRQIHQYIHHEPTNTTVQLPHQQRDIPRTEIASA